MYLAHNSIAMMEHSPRSPNLVPVAFFVPQMQTNTCLRAQRFRRRHFENLKTEWKGHDIAVEAFNRKGLPIVLPEMEEEVAPV